MGRACLGNWLCCLAYHRNRRSSQGRCLVRLIRRVTSLEARYSTDALLAAMTDDELGEAFDEFAGRLASAGLEPPCGWDGPLPALISWLARSATEH